MDDSALSYLNGYFLRRYFAARIASAIVSILLCGLLAKSALADEPTVVVSLGGSVELSRYYVHFVRVKHIVENPLAMRTDTPPQLKVVGGGLDPPSGPPWGLTGDGFATLFSFIAPPGLGFQPRPSGFPCRDAATYMLFPLYVGHEILETNNWYDSDLICFRHSDPFNGGGIPGEFIPGHTWTVHQNVKHGAPARRKALDGSQYDASPMVITRTGQPWMTYHWGYQLGLVASEATWNAANLSKVPELATWPLFPDSKDNFELTALPPPWVEDDVVEYVNRQDFPRQPGGQFFYAVLASDKAALDAVPNWARTGKAFKSGGYVSVCRFYGGKNGGPNTHFYSADDKECTALKAIPALSYEGQTFAVNMPMPGSNADGTKPCPIDSKPLYRLYNNASAPGKDYVSNHRYVTERSDVSAAVAQGWVDEGQVMCVPM